MNLSENLLTTLMEECAELSEASNQLGVRVSKALRFGLKEQYGDQPENAAWIIQAFDEVIREYADTLATIELLALRGDLPLPVTPMMWSGDRVRDLVEAKKVKIAGYIEYSRKQGTLE